MASITRLKSGRYRALVRKKGEKPKSATFDKRVDAKRWADEIERQIDSIRLTGAIEVSKDLLFSDFIDAYVRETSPVRPHGKNKAATLQALKERLAGVTMAEMTELRMRQFVAKRIKDKNQDGQAISGVTIGIDLSYITTVLKWARDVKGYGIDTAIANKARSAITASGLSTRSQEREREATNLEIQMLFEHYDRSLQLKLPMREIISFALATSMRLSEICNLKIEDIDRNKKTVIIRDRKHPREKIGNNQVVPLLPAAWEIAEKMAGDRTNGRVFAVDSRSVSASFTRACKASKIKDLRFHDLRHTAIGYLFAAGLSIEQVSLLSGHKDWKMLRRYTHIKAADVHKAFERLAGNR